MKRILLALAIFLVLVGGKSFATTTYLQMQQTRDTAANWTSNNPTLAAGQIGWESDTGKMKVGDGSTAWTSLTYIYPAINQTMYIGTTATAINRASAALALTGITSIDNGTTGTTIATVSTDKAAFYGAAPVVQQLATTDLGTVLSNMGIRVAGTAYPITTSGAVTMTGVVNHIYTPNALTVSSNAVTVPITNAFNTITNNAAATVVITLATSGAVAGERCFIMFYDDTNASQTLTWVNTENGISSTVPGTSNGSTTIPLSIGFVFNGVTSKWHYTGSAT